MLILGLTQFSMRYYVLRAAGEVANLASEGVCVSPEFKDHTKI